MRRSVVLTSAFLLSIAGCGASDAHQAGEEVPAAYEGDMHSESAILTVHSVKVSTGTDLCKPGMKVHPSNGYWVVVDVELENTGSHRLPLHAWSFNLYDEDGDEAGDSEGSGDAECVPRKQDPQIVDPGETGRTQFAVNSPAGRGTLVYEPSAIDDALVWSYPTS